MLINSIVIHMEEILSFLFFRKKGTNFCKRKPQGSKVRVALRIYLCSSIFMLPPPSFLLLYAEIIPDPIFYIWYRSTLHHSIFWYLSELWNQIMLETLTLNFNNNEDRGLIKIEVTTVQQIWAWWNWQWLKQHFSVNLNPVILRCHVFISSYVRQCHYVQSIAQGSVILSFWWKAITVI